MIKKIKRYIINSNYKKSLYFGIGYSLILELISMYFIISSWKMILFVSGIYDLVTWILLSLIFSTLSGYLVFVLHGGLSEKNTNPIYLENNFELKN